jgi:glycosyltransferase involved in cell wall biosynthesis
VIPSAIDLDLFRPGLLRSAAPSILAVGHRLGDRKRLDLLVDAFRERVHPSLREAELWLVCDDLVQGPGIVHRRALSSVDLADLFRRAWIFCLPSSYEGFGRPYVEALASGTPVVATPNPGSLEILEEGRWGVIARPEDLGDALLALLLDVARRDMMGTLGLQRAKRFGWDVVTGEYEAVYEHMLATHRRTR